MRDLNEITAVVRTWNDVEASWGPMPLPKAIALATDQDYLGHRYVEVGGVIIFDYDEIINAADEALRVRKRDASKDAAAPFIDRHMPR
jgi:hypothetical protein